MKRFFYAALVAGTIGMLPNPTPAAADCLGEAVESCNADFPGGDPVSVAIRGYCYAIRSAICGAFD